MRTRGLKLVINSEGIFKTKKTNIEDYKRKKLRKIYGSKIKDSLLNTLNVLINYYKDYNKDHSANENEGNIEELSNENEDREDELTNEDKIKDINNLIDKIRIKYDNNYEDYVTNISNRICNKCYDEYSLDERILKRKLFDITSNIKRVNNYELREKILLNQISIGELIKLEIVELAPEQVKNQRKAQVENHYIRDVILNSTNSDDSNSQSAIQSPRSSPYKEERSLHSPVNLERNDKLSTIENLKEFFLNNSTNKDNKDLIRDNNSTIDNDDVIRENSDINNTRIKDNLIINDDDDDLDNDKRSKSVKLVNPPNVSQYKYENISLRLANRINNLPTNFRRPFLDNFSHATRRLEILMKRSSILTGKFN